MSDFPGRDGSPDQYRKDGGAEFMYDFRKLNELDLQFSITMIEVRSSCVISLKWTR